MRTGGAAKTGSRRRAVATWLLATAVLFWAVNLVLWEALAHQHRTTTRLLDELSRELVRPGSAALAFEAPRDHRPAPSLEI
jgi:hypothetical protein